MRGLVLESHVFKCVRAILNVFLVLAFAIIAMTKCYRLLGQINFDGLVLRLKLDRFHLGHMQEPLGCGEHGIAICLSMGVDDAFDARLNY